MREDFIQTLQRFVATESVGPSALRNQGKGVLGAAQGYLARLRLQSVPRSAPWLFRKWLDRRTGYLLNLLPIENRPWGAARKALNLFLRDVLNNRHLCHHYGLYPIEPWLEIPLDNAVARGLKTHAKGADLPQWPGLKGLTPPVSDRFQESAADRAMRMGIHRVQMDMYLWLENR